MKKSKNYIKMQKIKKTKGTPHAKIEIFEFFTTILILIVENEYIIFSFAKSKRKCLIKEILIVK